MGFVLPSVLTALACGQGEEVAEAMLSLLADSLKGMFLLAGRNGVGNKK